MFDRTPPRPHPQVRVALTTLTAGQVTLETLDSWDGLRQYDVAGEDGTGGCQHVLSGGRIKLQSGPRVAEGRSQIVEEVLTKLKGCDWALFVDADMDFEADALCQLLGHAYDGNADADPFQPTWPVIGGLCFAGGYDRMYPTLYEGKKHSSGQVVPEPIADYPRDELVQVMATGAAFMAVHVKVLMHMTKAWPEGFGTDPHGQHNPHPWFVEGQNYGVQFGEDIAFCMRVNALGYPVAVHTGVKVGHVKKLILTEAVYDDYRRRRSDRKQQFNRLVNGELRLPEEVRL
jgi:hypothetical protein